MNHVRYQYQQTQSRANFCQWRTFGQEKLERDVELKIHLRFSPTGTGQVHLVLVDHNE